MSHKSAVEKWKTKFETFFHIMALWTHYNITQSLEYNTNPCRHWNVVICRVQEPTEKQKQRFNAILNVMTTQKEKSAIWSFSEFFLAWQNRWELWYYPLNPAVTEQALVRAAVKGQSLQRQGLGYHRGLCSFFSVFRIAVHYWHVHTFPFWETPPSCNK